MYGTGINNEGCVIDMAIELDVIQKSGSWYSYNGEKIGQGKDNVKIFLQQNEDVYNEVKELIQQKLRG